jgi:hypothetical protein
MLPLKNFIHTTPFAMPDNSTLKTEPSYFFILKFNPERFIFQFKDPSSWERFGEIYMNFNS